MPSENTSKHLLFGILALHNGLIKREDFLAAVAEWLEDKKKPIDQVLLERKALSEKDYEWLKPAVERHIQDHQGNATMSLAAVDSYDSVREQLEDLEDSEVEEALAEVDATLASDELDKYRTVGPTPSTPTSESQLGSRFRILRAHRGGGLGFVSVAEDEELHREVALKQIRQKYADDDKYRSRFRVEAEITGGLEHPSIVPVYGLGQDAAGRPFYAMRFIRGDSLKDAIKDFYESEELERDAGRRRLRFRELLRRFIDMCDAIHYAHSRGVLHRDLKPGNVMLGRYGETLVVDWGLAIPHGRDESTREESEEPTLIPTSVSETPAEIKGVPVGTPQYMAPEQATGRIDKMGPQTDVYALGATLYCILTGVAPFTDRDISTTLSKVERGNFPKPRTLSSDISKPLEAICIKAMATKIKDRYATARELAEDIERWLADEPVSAWQEPVHIRVRRWIRNHQRLVTGVAAAAAVTLVAAIVLFVVVNEGRRRLASSQKQFVDDQVNQLLDENAADDIAKFDTILSTLGSEPFPRYAVRRLAAEWKERFPTAQGDSSQALGLAAAIAGFASPAESFDGAMVDSAQHQLAELLLTAESPRDFGLADRYLVHDKQELWKVAAGNDDVRPFRALMWLAIHDENSTNWDDATYNRLAELLIGQDETHLSGWAERITQRVALGIEPFLEDEQQNASGQYKRKVAIALVALPTSAANLVNGIPTANIEKLAESLQKLASMPKTETSELENLAASDDLDAKGRANMSIALLYLRSPNEIKHLPIFPMPGTGDALDEATVEPSIEARLLFERQARDAGLSLSALHNWLQQISAATPEQKQTALQAMGQHDMNAELHRDIIASTKQLYRTDPDPGVHASAKWLLSKWNVELPAIEQNLQQRKNRWYVNERGQTFVRVDGDQTDFWVSTTEITVGDYVEYVKHREKKEQQEINLGVTNKRQAEIDAARDGRITPIKKFYQFLDPEYYERWQSLTNATWSQSVRKEDEWLPMNNLKAIHAMAYCTWATIEDPAIGDDELCYVVEGATSQNLLERLEAELHTQYRMVVKGCDRMKSGYRLPFQDEWERIAQVDNLQALIRGSNADDFSWHMKNSAGKLWPVGKKRPNRFGVFDLFGNVAEFYQLDATDDGLFTLEAKGGSYMTPPSEKYGIKIMAGHPSLGLRLVQTAK